MADLNLGTYSPEDMLAIISVQEVTHAMSGYAEGTFVTVDRVSPSSTMQRGATRSGHCRILRNDDAATVTFTLTQSSSDNDVLSALWRKDKEARDNTWLFNLTLVDGTGRSVFHCRQCFIENMPSGSFGTEAESRAWVIQCMQMDEYIGGNAVLPPEVINTLAALGITVADRWK